jgi:hypothetical protein
VQQPAAQIADLMQEFGLAVLEDDLVVAQITKSILPFVGRNDGPSVLALDQFNPHPGSPSSSEIRRCPENSSRSKARLGPLAKATPVGASS